MIEQARRFATKAHGDQMYGDQPYTYHLGKVVDVLVRFKHEDPALLAAGWLHDTLEDTSATFDDIQDEFGFEIAALVDAVTDGPGSSRAERKIRPYNMIPKCPGAVILKLADRIANIEASLDEGHDRLLKRYAKEHPSFHAALFDGRLAMDMWEHLDKIFELGGCGNVTQP